MTEQAPEPRTQAERVARLFVASIVPSLLAVIAVASVITALYVWHQDTVTTHSIAADSTDSAPATVGSPRVTPTPTASGPSPAASPSATPSPSKSSSAAANRTATPRTTSAKPVVRLSVVVLNQTSRTGLARSVSERLRARGWNVVQVGNFRGSIPATTVYYPGGARSSALALARELPVQARTRPIFGNLSNSRLTVVVADDYPRLR
jgi:hypothetical protein